MTPKRTRTRRRSERLTAAPGVALCLWLVGCAQPAQQIERETQAAPAAMPAFVEQTLDVHRACDTGDPDACANLSQMYWSRAIAEFDKRCQGGDMSACYEVGVSLLLGDGIEPNPERGRQLLTTACEGGQQKACEALEKHGAPASPVAP